MHKSEAFLHQARTDFHIFEELWKRDHFDIPTCHALQHLQMATEKLSKSILISLDPLRPDSHVAFREIQQYLRRPDVAKRLGYSQDASRFRRFLENRKDWFRDIERLSPSVGTNVDGGGSEGPNVEYPWSTNDAGGSLIWIAPRDYDFAIAKYLRSSDGAYFIKIISRLLERLPHAVIGD